MGSREEILARARDVGIDLDDGASIVVARAHAHVTTEDGWRQRVLATAERGARAAVAGAVAALTDRPDAPGTEVVVLVPGGEDEGLRAAEGVLRELRAGAAGPLLRARPLARRGRPDRSSTAPATRRCSPPTSPRATRTGPCSPSRRPARTACCCRR